MRLTALWLLSTIMAVASATYAPPTPAKSPKPTVTGSSWWPLKNIKLSTQQSITTSNTHQYDDPVSASVPQFYYWMAPQSRRAASPSYHNECPECSTNEYPSQSPVVTKPATVPNSILHNSTTIQPIETPSQHHQHQHLPKQHQHEHQHSGKIIHEHRGLPTSALPIDGPLTLALSQTDDQPPIYINNEGDRFVKIDNSAYTLFTGDGNQVGCTGFNGCNNSKITTKNLGNKNGQRGKIDDQISSGDEAAASDLIALTKANAEAFKTIAKASKQ